VSSQQGLERKLLFYRGVAVVLAALLGLLALKLVRLSRQVGDFGEAGQTWTVDLADRAQLIEETRGDQADYSETYLVTPEGSVHLHAMGHLQVTPLHLHPASEELVVIASGTAHVTHAWGAEGGVERREADYPPGSVIASPRFTAHEWSNRAPDRMLFNVVFTSPRFSGNFYVHPDDPRIRGEAPCTLDPVREATEQLTRLPQLGGRLWSKKVSSSWRLPPTSGAPVMAYVFAGQGTVDGEALKPDTLVHLESRGALELRAEAPLSLLLFDVTGKALPGRGEP